MDSFDRTYASGGSAVPVYTAVKLDANGKAVPAGAGEKALGIATIEAKATDKAVAVRTGGYAMAVAGGAVSPGDRLKVGASGKVVKQSGEATGTQVECIGYADTAATADGDWIEIRVIPHQITA